MRAVLHVHSDWSHDGRWPLRRIARLFGSLGARAVLMTEHDDTFDAARFDAYRAACAAASTGACRLVPGIEYSSPDNAVHILSWGLDRFLGAHRPTLDTLHDIRAAGGVAVLAHPRRRDVWRHYDDRWTPLLHGIEIWNRKADGLAPGPEALALAARTGLPPTVGVDFHVARHLWPLHVSVPDGPPDSVVEAVRSGQLGLVALGVALPGRGPTPLVHRLLEGARRAAAGMLRRGR